MGNLLRLLAREPTKEDEDIFVDFENAQVTESEQLIHEQLLEVISNCETILTELRNYRGAVNEISQVIREPTQESEKQLWTVLVPCLEKLKLFYDFSHTLRKTIPKILEALCCNQMSPHEHLKTQQALVKHFAHLLDFVLTFDELKMSNPNVQNDLSYYRRLMSQRRIKSSGEETSSANEFGISEGIAGEMTLFYAHATPMLNVLSNITVQAVSNHPDISLQAVTETFSTMIRVCQKMIEKRELYERLEREETILFILRVMIGLIILFDHVHPDGAFVKSSHIDIKSSVKIIKEQHPNENLLNALRFTTKHLRDEATPPKIKIILA